MRNNNLKDLYITYPFMPVESAPDWYKDVKFMRIMVTLPAMQPVASSSNGDHIVATLTAITPTAATVKVMCAIYGYTEEDPLIIDDIPVFTGGIPTGNSYLYTDTTLPTLSGLSCRIHPSCLAFQQRAPKLTIEGSTTGTPPNVMLEYGTGVVPQWIVADAIEAYEVDDVLWLTNGHNVEVSGSSDSVLFTGAPGAGKGMWETDPYTRAPSYNGYLGKALRSINGHSGIMLLQGDRSVDITAGRTGETYYDKLIIKKAEQA